MNKGAQLMLIETVRQLGKRIPDAGFCAPMPFRRRAADLPRFRALGMGVIPFLSKWKFRAEIPGVFLSVLSGKDVMHTRRKVALIADISGYALSDKWGILPAKRLGKAAKAVISRGGQLLLLPQALGPFEDEKVRRACLRVFEQAGLIMPRDAVSEAALRALFPQSDKIRPYPDFTALAEAVHDPAYSSYAGGFCIVPNCRMLDKVPPAEAAHYLGFLQQSIAAAQALACRPFFLIHEGEGDRRIAEQLNAGLAQPLDIVAHSDPRVLKGVLGQSYAVVSSRYHAVIGALSQGVPCLSTSWSHKYEALAEAYGCPELVLRSFADETLNRDALRRISDSDSNKAYRQQLLPRADAVKQQAVQMWDEAARWILDSLKQKN
ncbi:colanic acid/amylovoran biosynthesis protein [Cyclonatronum proteinivorum]|uniref:Colanic acid/amylovoran biosynthesis protein n=1 Tax=Cyclonatronum proteinivorum TaxID=1457365 RepID=A0A345UML8_9BACT|nr:polysaccharide pyruvyl transferase family protein [Cyclonatronum proteinivorum]AXJ01720.1 colanic acid/amylovoran biosynthesis protein [Cyclonatronum proteinivorum]